MIKRVIVYFVVVISDAIITDFTVRNAHTDSAMSWCIFLGVMSAFILGIALGESPLPKGDNNDLHAGKSINSDVS